MSKGNMLLGYARGSVGDLTFYRRNAQQITRARSRIVKNPKTLAQQMQRAIMRTAVGAYGVIKEICDHSYEGVAYGADSYAKFLKLNLDMLRSLAAAGGENTKSFLPSGFNGLVAMPWVLSKGSITWGGVEINFSNGVNIVFNGSPEDVSIVTDVSYQGFIDFLNLRVGDQVTLIALPKRSDIDESSCLEPVISRFILAPSEGELSNEFMFSANGSFANNANALNENTDAFTFRFQSGKLMASRGFSSSPPDDFIGAAAIISRRATDGSWLRSAAIMAVNSAEQSGGYTLRQASMVVTNDITTASDWYLNNANKNTQVEV